MSSISESQAELQELIGDDYTLQWVVGHGGMSTVWLADDNLHQREVAIKVLRPEFSDNDEFLSRFRNEALASEKIESENVVATYDYREINHHGRTLCFIVMEYVRGESLADLLARKKSLPEELVLDVLEQAAHGLSVIHRMGMVHRDIKPGNLMVTQVGQVKITDFGIAKAAAAVPLTRTGMVVGTAQYVSPEQAQGHDVLPSSDVYSLGVVGYEMLAGERPFVGDSSVSVAIAHINQAPPALPTTISAPARELIGIALRKEADARYADGNELALAVHAARMGKRPPQPKSAPLNRIAPQPSPTASTHALGQVAQPTTVVPASAYTSGHVPRAQAPHEAPAPGAVPSPAPQRRQAPQKKKGGAGLATGFGLALLTAAAVGAVVFGFSQGWFGSGNSEDTVPPTPETITVTEENTPEQLTPAPAPEPVTPTRQEQPTTDATQSATPTMDLPSGPDNPNEAETVTLDPENTDPATPPAPTPGNEPGNTGQQGQGNMEQPEQGSLLPTNDPDEIQSLVEDVEDNIQNNAQGEGVQQ